MQTLWIDFYVRSFAKMTLLSVTSVRLRFLPQMEGVVARRRAVGETLALPTGPGRGVM